MINFFINNLIWTQGFVIFIFCIITAISGYFFCKWLLFASVVFLIFTFFFFRNPVRSLPEGNNNIIISPADGTIIDIQSSSNGAFEGFDHKISIFLSPFDVHVNWIPISGIIEHIIYKPGKFFVAFEPKSSELNERNEILITDRAGHRVLVRQIAGFIARRIVCWVKPKEYVKIGQKYGMIKFGSRVEIFLPSSVQILVKKNQYVCGGSTVIGRWIC